MGIVDVVEDIVGQGLKRGFSQSYRGRRVLSTNIPLFTLNSVDPKPAHC